MTEPSDSTATRSWVRHPSDLARLAMSLLALTAGLAVVATHPDLVRGVSSDLIRLVLRLPHGVRASLLGLTQLAAVLAPAALVGLLALHRRVRLAAIVLGAAGLAALVMVVLQRWLDGTVPSQVLERSEGQSWVSGAAFPSGTYLAALTAAVVVLTPLAGPAGRRAAWLGVFAAATCRLVTAVAVPVNLVVTVAIGAVVGSLSWPSWVRLDGGSRSTRSRRGCAERASRWTCSGRWSKPRLVGASRPRPLSTTARSRRW